MVEMGIFNQHACMLFLNEFKQSHSLLRQVRMALQAVLVVLLSSVALSASQSCGTLNCTQEYDNDCIPDVSSALYDNCRTSQSNCTDPIGPADNL